MSRESSIPRPKNWSVLLKDFSVKTKKSAKPLTYGGVAIDEDEFEPKPRKPRGPTRAAEDKRTECRLARPDGLFWKGPPHRWPEEGDPIFDKAGQKWSSKSRALQLWAQYNIARSVQKADWPDLHLEAFEITVKRLDAPTDQPVDTTKVALWYERFPKYDGTRNRAVGLFKDGYPFAFIMEYNGDGSEVKGLECRVEVHTSHSYSTSGLSSSSESASVAFLNERDMVFARVAIGDKVDLIVNDLAEIIYKKDDGK